MAKTYVNLAAGTDSIGNSRNITVAGPFDVRDVVDTYDDLFVKSTFGLNSMYIGMMVTTYDTQDVYVLVKKPGSRDNDTQYRNNIQWKKVGGSDFNPEDYLEYFQDNLGSKVVTSPSDLAALSGAYPGMMVYVQGDGSEDEGGIYILMNEDGSQLSNWKKISTGGSGSSADASAIFTTDGTIPSSGDGFSISKDDPSGFVEEVYVDSSTGLKAGEYYTGRGLNTSDKNGGEGVDVEYIYLYNGGESSIKLFGDDSENWIEIHIADDSLGISKEDIKYIDADGVEHVMEESTLILPKETPISFANGLNLDGLTEYRDGDWTKEYTFGEDGSTYEDVDIYSTNTIPTVYAYSDGHPIKVLTDGDKTELITLIEERTDIETIPEADIMDLFGEKAYN